MKSKSQRHAEFRNLLEESPKHAGMGMASVKRHDVSDESDDDPGSLKVVIDLVDDSDSDFEIDKARSSAVIKHEPIKASDAIPLSCNSQ